MKSPLWFKKRNLTFKRLGAFCHKCKSKKNLHVHHKTYKRLGHEDIFEDLVPLCITCHEACHLFCKENKIDLLVGTEAFLTADLNKNVKEQINKLQHTFLIKPFAHKLKKEEQAKKEKSAFKSRGYTVDIQKFMALYGVDEQTAKEINNIK